jgi:hypothetical protein
MQAQSEPESQLQHLQPQPKPLTFAQIVRAIEHRGQSV